MKKTAITIAAILLVFSISFAGTVGVNPPKSNKVLQTKIANSISYPEFALKDKIECTVLAIVKIETNGDITVIKCDSREPLMTKYVSEKLAGMKLADPSIEIGKEFLLRVNFEMLK